MNELLLADKITANCLNHKEKRNETANFRCQMSLFFTDMSLLRIFMAVARRTKNNGGIAMCVPP